MIIPERLRRLLFGLLLASVVLVSPARAQETEVSPARSQIAIVAGDVLEVLGVHAGTDGNFTWVLTRNGTFMEAGRSAVFRTRFTQAGGYTLVGQMSTDSQNRRMQIDITVEPPTGEFPEEQPQTIGRALDIVRTNRGTVGRIAVSREQPLLTLTPSAALTGTIRIDLDTRTDANGDGDSTNDNDVADTLFAREHNVLHLWYTEPELAGPIRVATVAADGTELTQSIAVVGGAVPIPSGSIFQTEEYNGTVRFAFENGQPIDPSDIVFHWDFGDGRQSLVDAPSHTYFSNGEYAVHVTVRELATGRVIAEGQTDVQILSLPITGNSTSSVSSASSSAPSGSTGGTFAFIWSLIKILAVLLIAIVVGGAGTWIIATFLRREGTLQKALEQAEGKLLRKDPTAPSALDATPVTLKLKRTDPVTDVVSSGPESTPETYTPPAAVVPPVAAPTPEPPPVVRETAPPTWLQEGLETAKKETPELLTPTSDILPPAPEPAPTPEPAPPTPPLVAAVEPVEAPESPAASEDDLLPAWLKEDQTQAVPTPEVKPETPETSQAPVPSVPSVSPLPAPFPPANPVPMPFHPNDAATAAQIEHERERKRRKRQRYRENLRKRKAEEIGTVDPVAPKMPIAETPIVPAEPFEPEEEVTASPMSTSAPDLPTPPVAPVMQSIVTMPVQDIPQAENAPNSSPDDKIAFVIKAEGVDGTKEDPPKASLS